MERTIKQILGLASLTLTVAVGGKPLEAGALPARVVEEYGRHPLVFEENRGQSEDQVRFLAKGSGYSLFLTASEAVLALRDGDSSHALRLGWRGTAPEQRISGEAELPGRSHYLLGSDPARWHTGIRSYERVRYPGVYPGIDLVFYGNQERLEYDFVLAPGADPRTIRMTVDGADRKEIDTAGDLVLSFGGGEVRLKKPISYQMIDGERREVGVRWRLLGGEIGFATAAYDRTKRLVIDPVLVYSTYLGGNSFDLGSGIAVDAAGNAYVVGLAGSFDFPVGGAPPAPWDAYIVKLSPTGQLVFATYLGGSGVDEARAVAVDAAGFIHLAGDTSSSDFPRINPAQPPFSGEGRDAFVAKLRPDGSGLVYSTNLGGLQDDQGLAIALDPSGNTYVTGVTSSPGFPLLKPLPFPLLLPPPTSTNQHAFVTKLSPSGSLAYSTFLGGSRHEFGFGIAADAAGHAYVVGITGSVDFPVAGAFQSSLAGGFGDGFVTKLHPSGSSLVWSTYLGGSGYEQVMGVALGPGGRVSVVGLTDSNNFPLLRPLQAVRRGGDDLFVTVLSPGGSSLFWSTYFGGRWNELVQAIALDVSGRIYLTGRTESLDYPLENPLQRECAPVLGPFQCVPDAIVTTLDPEGPGLLFSTYLGGAEELLGGLGAWDTGLGIAVDSRGSVYVTGYAYSTDFPVVNALQPLQGGNADGFVVKVAENRPPDCSAASASPALLWPPNGNFVPISIQGVSDVDGDPVTLRVTSVRQDEPLTRTGTPDAAGIGTPTASVRSDRAGQGNGRVYHLTFEARDGSGGTCTGKVTLCVPHDRRPGGTCGDGGALFNSAG